MGEMGQIHLPSGQAAQQIRRLQRSERALFCDHLLRLDKESRFDRFGMAMNDRALSDYAARCFETGALVFGYFVDGVLRGAGELHGLGQCSADDEAEAAFSVEKPWRKLGVGRALLARIVETARDIGAHTIHLTCLPHNRAMQRLVQSYDPDMRFETAAATGRLVARATPSPRGHASTPWKQSFDASGYHAMMELAPPSAQ